MRLFCTGTRSSRRAVTRIAAAGLVSAGAIAIAAFGGPASAASAASAGEAPSVSLTCSGVVAITHLAFKPAVVFPGETSTVKLVAQNCTNKTQTASLTWLGRFENGSGAIPSGCPAIDPLSQGATFAPNGILMAKVSYLVPAGCTATFLVVTARISLGATVLAHKTARLTITPPPA